MRASLALASSIVFAGCVAGCASEPLVDKCELGGSFRYIHRFTR